MSSYVFGGSCLSGSAFTGPFINGKSRNYDKILEDFRNTSPTYFSYYLILLIGLPFRFFRVQITGNLLDKYRRAKIM